MRKNIAENIHLIVFASAVISGLMLLFGTKTEFEMGAAERITGFLPAAGIIFGTAVQSAASLISRHKNSRNQ